MSERRALSRFIEAQSGGVYEEALAEIRGGYKEGHWMWFVFPQMEGLGFSGMAQFYGIQDLEEAKAYLADATLGTRLREICAALLALSANDPHRVFGSPDDLKLRSSMTLFALAAPEEKVFADVLDKYYGGAQCARTVAMIQAENR
ncbi:MAG: DUF1810 domain-containing protein [Oscillospiraceae bacterium]|jgi:uncharacterized protein (DUF1810 family)|nr:DUF1810 domain-containing protein [Oscillospiraceae bacterium]